MESHGAVRKDFRFTAYSYGLPCEECGVAWSVQQSRPRSPPNSVFCNDQFGSAGATPIASSSDSIGADTLDTRPFFLVP